MSRKVVRGAIWTVGGRVAGLLASFVSIPFITRLMGAEQYGIWALASSLNAYLTFSDMGMGLASTRFAAGAYAREDEKQEVAVVWTSLLITLLPASAGMLLVVLGANLLAGDVFGVPGALRSTATIVIQLTAIGFVGRVCANTLNTSQIVRFRMDVYATLGTLLQVAQHGAVVAVLILGGGIIEAAGAVTVCCMLTALTHGVASWRMLPALARPRIDPTLIGPLLRFGSGMVVSSLLAFLLTNIERLLLAHYGSVRDLAYYTIAANLAGLVAMVPTAIHQSLLPALSALHAAKQQSQLQDMCGRALQAVMCVILPASLMVCAVGEPLLRLWAGVEFAEHSRVPLYILLGGVVCSSMATVPYTLLTATGRTGTIARCYLTETVPYLICASGLTWEFGLRGAAIAWSLRTLVDAALLFGAARQEVGVSWVQLLSRPRRGRSFTLALLFLLALSPVAVGLGERPFLRIAIVGAGCAVFWGVVGKHLTVRGEERPSRGTENEEKRGGER